MVLMRIFLFSNLLWKWKFIHPFFNCPTDDGSVAWNIGWEVRLLKMSNICNAPIFHFPWDSFGTCFRPRPFWPGPGEAPVSWLKLDSKCCHFFLVQTMFHNIDMNMILSSKKSGFCPFKCFWVCFLFSSFESPGNSCQTNCTSRDNKLKCSTYPCPFESCKYASLRSINIIFVVAHPVSNLLFLGSFCSSPFFLKSSWFFVSQDAAHKQSLVNWLQIATLSGAFFSISMWVKMNFLFTCRIFCSNRSSMLRALSWWLLQNLADTSFHAWSRFQLSILVKVLRYGPCRHSCR